MNSKLLFCVSFIFLASCTVDPFSSILFSAALETKREAENNYIQAKQLEKEGRYQDAFWRMRRAANGRYGQAAYELGNYYVDGVYTAKSYKLARHYYFIAAYEADLRGAYLSLAEIDFYGRGRPRAIELGYKWMLLGVRGDSQLQKQMQLQMDPEMTAKGIANAQAKAQIWLRSRKYNPESVAVH